MLERIKVLVIDDEEGFSFLMKLYFEDFCNFDTQTAHTGAGGLEAFDQQRPDVVLVDLNLPDIDGLEVARLLVERSEDPSYPVFLITASLSRIRESIGAVPGVMDGFRVFSKPLDPAYVASLIRFCVRGEPLGSNLREPPLLPDLVQDELFDFDGEGDPCMK